MSEPEADAETDLVKNVITPMLPGVGFLLLFLCVN